MPQREREAQIRYLAARLLLRLRPANFQALGLMDLGRYARDCGYLVDTVQGFARRTGMELPTPLPDGLSVAGDTPLILYAASLGKARRNFTIAHELGHLTLGHRAPGAISEREADLFAVSLLCPDCLLYAREADLGRNMTAEEMCAEFPISLACAKRKRADLDAYGFSPFGEGECALVRALMKKEASD